LQTFQKKYSTDKFAIFSIGNLSNPKAVKKYVFDQGLKGEEALFPVLIKGWKVFKAYKGRSTPITFLIDKTGKVRFIHRTFNPGMEKTFKREIDALLAETA
jgi:peroxiredoxin